MKAKYFNTVSSKTQLDHLIIHFETRGNISALEAASLYKVRSLSKRVCELKNLGYIIKSEMKADETGQRYARYFHTGYDTPATRGGVL